MRVNDELDSFELCVSAISSATVHQITDDPETHRLVVACGFNAFALQSDRGPSADPEFTYNEHRSLGYLGQNGDFLPVVTVLEFDYLYSLFFKILALFLCFMKN